MEEGKRKKIMCALERESKRREKLPNFIGSFDLLGVMRLEQENLMFGKDCSVSRN